MKKFGKIVNLEVQSIRAQIAPEMGLSLVSFSKEGRELLDPGAEGAFIKTRKGLGPLILPHFNQEGPLPRKGGELFPFGAELQALGIEHPFQHGVGRYAPWEFSATESSLTGHLDGEMRWKGVSLSDLAGLDFSARVSYRLNKEGLEIDFDLQGDQPVAAGIHFYYNLGGRSAAQVHMPPCAQAEPDLINLGEPINKVFLLDTTRKAQAVCRLETGSYSLDTIFPVGGPPEESFESLVIFCPPGADFVCVEPLSYPVGEGNTKKAFRSRIFLAPR